MSSRIEDFLLGNEGIEQTKEVVLSPRFKDKEGNPVAFKIKTITEAEHKEISKSCTTYTTNKRTHQKERDFDSAKYRSMVVIACTEEPNFKNAELQDKYNCQADPVKLMGKVLLPGEYSRLEEAVFELNGFNDDINDLADEVKN